MIQTKKNNNSSGYYWIKLHKNSDWIIGLYNQTQNSWMVAGMHAVLPKPPILVEWTKIQQYIGINKSDTIMNKIANMKVGETFNKGKFVNDVWGFVDFFTVRSFDTLFANCKKKIPQKKFKGYKGLIERTE